MSASQGARSSGNFIPLPLGNCSVSGKRAKADSGSTPTSRINFRVCW